MKFSIDKKWLTLIEMMIVIVILAIWIMGVLTVITYWLNFVGQIRQEVIATNLAREWVEWVYNIRDTNRERWSGRRDECWLLKDPLGNDSDCQDEPWIEDDEYILTQNEKNDNKYYLLTWDYEPLDVFDDDELTDQDRRYSLRQEDWYWESAPDTEEYPTPEWMYFRMIDVQWLYDKRDNVDLDCSSWDVSDCWDSDPKELRFCSVVQYLGDNEWEVELCSSVTNFRE